MAPKAECRRITGTIKANFPTRIFQVTSKIDRTILGEQGGTITKR